MWQAAGNEAFKAGNFDEAIKQFTLAIQADDTNHVLYSNRSGAYASKEDYKAALSDANQCVATAHCLARSARTLPAAEFTSSSLVTGASNSSRTGPRATRAVVPRTTA